MWLALKRILRLSILLVNTYFKQILIDGMIYLCPNGGMNYTKFLAESRKRAVEILCMRDKGDTFATIGKKFDITAQRAQQIYKAAKHLTKGK